MTYRVTSQVEQPLLGRDPGELVRRILDLTGWSQQRLVSELRWTARELDGRDPRGLNTTTVSRWKQGHQGATSYYLRLLHHLSATVERGSRSCLRMGADEGMHLPWTAAGTVAVLEDWLVTGLIDRRRFVAVSGSALVAIATRYLNLQHGRSSRAGPVDVNREADTLLSHVEHSVQVLRTLDDAEGGASHLAYVGAQFQALGLVLREGGHDARTTQRLFSALAELGQQAGWMACDAAQDGLAQRYLFSALRAAHEASDPSMAAHVLADLSYLAASRHDPRDGVFLGEAALRAATCSPASVRASVMTRLAHANAAAGQFREFTRNRYGALELLEKRVPGQDPKWMYYLTPNHVDAQAGYSLVQAGCHARSSGDRSGARRLLIRGEALLRTGAHSRALTDPHQRRALHEGAWLARCYAAEGDLDSTGRMVRTCIGRLHRVRSPRSVALLDAVAADLRHFRALDAVELRHELTAALTQHSQ